MKYSLREFENGRDCKTLALDLEVYGPNPTPYIDIYSIWFSILENHFHP